MNKEKDTMKRTVFRLKPTTGLSRPDAAMERSF